MNNLAPIVLFVYNRLEHTQKTIDALKSNCLASHSDLIIFCDGARSSSDEKPVNAVRAFVRSIDGFESIRIVESGENKGLANSIISGVTEIVNKFGKVIVLEDDLVTHQGFLTYMNESLTKYQGHSDVASIHGFVLPVDGLPENFFIKGADCWGWGTWKDKWAMFEASSERLISQFTSQEQMDDFNLKGSYDYLGMLHAHAEGRNDSWAIRWHASTYLKDKLTLSPGKSLVVHIGYDQGQHHSNSMNMLQNGLLSDSEVSVVNIEIKENIIAKEKLAQFWINNRPSLIKRVIRKINKIFSN